jgi:CHAT domain-containing protein
MRARRLRDLTARAGAAPAVERTASEAAEAAALDARLAELNRALLSAPPTEAAAVREELAAVRAELSAFELRMSAAHPETARPRLVVAELSPPPAGTAVIEYVVLPKRTIAFVLRGDGSGNRVVVARELAVPSERLVAVTEAFVRAIERLDFAVDDAGAAVRTLIFDPLEADLDGVTNLRLVPSGVLWNVPFDALRKADGSYLADRFSISYTPALSFQPNRAPRPAAPTLLAVANPETRVASSGGRALVRLDDAQQEAEAIGALYGARARVLTGAAATEVAFRSNARSYSVLHLATHGLLDDRAPLFSSLLLTPDASDDGLLEAREILEAGLQAELIVLSACETGRGLIGQGEGIVGMTWAALAGGASTVVVSQWKAESRSTRALMVEFHRELLSGREKAEALAIAKRRVKRRPEFAHPFFWAAFVVVGAAR